MMKHPAVHIALVVMIAAMLTLVARGCDGDHESELPPGPVADAELPAAAEPPEGGAARSTPDDGGPPPVAEPDEGPSAKRMNPCLKLTPPAAPVTPLLTPQPPGPDAAAVTMSPAGGVAGEPAPAPAPPPGDRGPGGRVNPCLKRTPPAGDTTVSAPPVSASAPEEAPPPAIAAKVPDTPDPAPAPAASAKRPTSAIPPGNPCMKRPPLPMYTGEMVVRETPPAPSPVERQRPAARPAGPIEPAAPGARRGPLLASSLDDGGPGEHEAPAPQPAASSPRLATSMDDGAPAATPSPGTRFRPGSSAPPPTADEPAGADHETQHAQGVAHDHGEDRGGEAPRGDPGDTDERARHMARMKAGRHTDLSHVRLDPPDYSPPERYRAGKNLYEAHCHACHGDRATGTDKAPPLLHPYYDPNDHGDEYFYNAVAKGAEQHLWKYGDMPALPHVSHDQVRAIIGYVRWLQRQVNIY